PWTLVITMGLSKESVIFRRGVVMKKLVRAFTGAFRHGKNRTRGQSLVEFAMVAPLFFLLVFGITDFARLFFSYQTLQYAVREAGRYAVTGQHSGTSSRVDSIKSVITKASQGINITSMSVSSGSTTNYGGGPRQTCLVTVTSSVRLITPMI